MLETEDLRREHTEQSRIHQSAFFEFQQKHEKIIAELFLSW